MSAFHNNALLGASGQQGYTISRSCRFRSSASAYFNRTPASAGNQQKFTFSAWLKRGALPSGYVSLFAARTGSSGTYAILWLYNDTLSFQTSATSNLTTSAVYRDPSAWYHIVLSVDTTQATASNRTLLYVNGVQVTAFSTATYPAQNATLNVNSTANHFIGQQNSSEYFDGYLTEINFIDGQALTPSSFGETDTITGVWKPKKYAGTYGTNGFYLNFSDNSAATAAAIGKDYSGNGNNWTPNNISVTAGATYDSMIDTPTSYADGGNGRGNYCVLNAINYLTTAPTNANLRLNLPSGGTVRNFGTIGVTSGKWYWETTITAFNPSPFNGYMLLGATTNIAASGTGYYCYVGSNDVSVAGYKTNGTNSAYGANYTAGDVVGVALDLDSGTITFYKNNVSQGVAYSSLPTSTYFPFIYNDGSASNPTTYDINFGQRPFSYTPPSGFKALNTQNLPEPTIKAGNKYFDTLLWTSNASVKSVTGSAFQPDLVWVKDRVSASANEGYHHLVDSVRGAGKVLSSNATLAEYWSGTNQSVTAFNSNGFSSGIYDGLNGDSMVTWVWNAGSGTTSSNTSGSITSTVSVNATAGFSIVTYTGTGANATVGHGLGVAPSMTIVKSRNPSGAWNWAVQHNSLTDGTYYLQLNTTAAQANAGGVFTAFPSSTVLNLGSNASVNESAKNLVAYCWAAVAGYSAFGKYTGNGSSDGPFVYCGFRPRYVLIKSSSNVTNWQVIDTARDTYNQSGSVLWPNLSNSEDNGGADASPMDFLSNGFKLRSATADTNINNYTYIYAAFAENPFKNSLAR